MALSVQPFGAVPRRVGRHRQLALAVALLTTACTATITPPRVSKPMRDVVRVDLPGGIASVPIEEYVRGVVMAEAFPRSARDPAARRMLEVQAIVSRTYALTPRHARQAYDVCATTHCQLYVPSRARSASWRDAVGEAVATTAGTILWFADAPARVVYHADCGGHTSAAPDIWRGDPLPYLIAVADEVKTVGIHQRWRFAPGRAALVRALNGDDRTRVGARLLRIDIVDRDRAGRALTVALEGERSPVVRGEELRSVLTRAFGPRAFRSTRFEVRRTATGFEFTGRGFGHGVGLCQAGAFARLKDGASVAQVLAHYFPGTSLRSAE